MFTKAQMHAHTQTGRQFSAEASQGSQQHGYYPADASTRGELRSKHISRDDLHSAATDAAAANGSAWLSVTCQGATPPRHTTMPSYRVCGCRCWWRWTASWSPPGTQAGPLCLRRTKTNKKQDEDQHIILDLAVWHACRRRESWESRASG